MTKGRSIPPLAKSTARQAVLPGHGEIGAGCGSSIAMHCNHCGHSYTLKSSCMRRSCPHCGEKWARREARIASERLWAGANLIMHGTPRRAGYRVVHCVVSMNDQDDDINDQRTKANVVLKRHGIAGGLMIYHPFRKDDQDKAFVPDGHVHFHVIGIAPGNIQAGGLPSDNGAVFKVIKDARRGDFRGLHECGEVRSLAFYQLTHCGILEGKHALTWFGTLSYNAISNKTLDMSYPGYIERLTTPPPKRCPTCGSEDVEPDWIWDRTAYPFDRVFAGLRPPDKWEIEG